jgi:hypothetical protein
MRRAALRVRGGAVGPIDGGEERIIAVGPLIHLPNTLRAQAEGLIRLMAGRASAPVCPQALKEGAFFVDVASAVECRDGARLVLETLEIRNDENQGSRSAQRNGSQRKTDGWANPGMLHVTFRNTGKIGAASESPELGIRRRPPFKLMHVDSPPVACRQRNSVWNVVEQLNSTESACCRRA